MNCLLLAATAKEIAPFLSRYRQNDSEPGIDILIGGVGLTATTFALAKQIAMKRPELVIQAGIAGCFDKNLSLGSVVVVKQDTIADLGVIENKELKSMFDLGLINSNQAPFKKEWLINPNSELIKKTKLKSVRALSVNQITTSKPMIDLYRNKFAAVTESMEGAALHYVCGMEKIPFLQIRSISNYVGERNKAKWDLKNSIMNLNNELIRIIETLTQ